MLKYHIREGLVSDIDQTVQIRAEGWEETYPISEHNITVEDIQLEELVSKESIEKRKQSLSSQKLKMWVAVADETNEIIGYTSFTAEENMQVLSGLYVRKPYRGQGVAKALTLKALELLDSTKPIYLDVVSYNQPAIKLYQNFGFVKTDEKIKREFVLLRSGKKIPLQTMVKKPS